jgi:hypothetical protein
MHLDVNSIIELYAVCNIFVHYAYINCLATYRVLLCCETETSADRTRRQTVRIFPLNEIKESPTLSQLTSKFRIPTARKTTSMCLYQTLSLFLT